MPPHQKIRGVLFVLSCLSVVNFNLPRNFWTVRVFDMHTPLMMPFLLTPRSMTLTFVLKKKKLFGLCCCPGQSVFLFFFGGGGEVVLQCTIQNSKIHAHFCSCYNHTSAGKKGPSNEKQHDAQKLMRAMDTKRILLRLMHRRTRTPQLSLLHWWPIHH